MCLSQGVLTCVSLSQDVLMSNKASMAGVQAELAETKDSVRQMKVSRLLGGWGVGGGASAQPMCTAGHVLTDLSTSVKSCYGVLQVRKLKAPPGLRSSCPSATNRLILSYRYCFLSWLGPAGRTMAGRSCSGDASGVLC